MEKFEFIGFEETPTEKYMGILTVRVHGSVVIILRYKIIAKKDNSGFFPTCASYKMSNRMPGNEYHECFMLDSRSDNEQIIKFVMHNFNNWYKAKNAAPVQNIQYPYPHTNINQSNVNPPDDGNLPF